MQTATKNISKTLPRILFTALFIMLCFINNTIHIKAEYKKVKESDLPLSTMNVYRDMDTAFLKKFPFGTTYKGDVFVELETAQQMVGATDIRLKEGRVVQTSGFYEIGDGGGATYILSSEKVTGSIQLDIGL